MFRIGLTGGIAAGKSAVAERLAERGAVVVDYDLLAREAVRPGSVGLDGIVAAFGADVVLPDGTLDRAATATLVFGDAQARARLDAIVHPEVRRLAAEREAAVAAGDARAVVVHDVPLLVETGRTDDFDLVLVVQAPEALRRERLVAGRGLSTQDAGGRIAAQASDEQRAAAADVLLDGSGDLAALRAQVDDLWARIAAEVAAEADEPA
ncbi:dephospho-CoA kinase [Cellulomonas sp. PhB143]|uniref:dephospho-CoA kinase n=1 Tax=Cellulomonas sp. PhB143 TaxID=2485186 RepID=UPI000F47F21E|nr:dephospho-CoA kinase [Cellulomonas sp. PhB143]ROS74412.1 dephospho-CoA kinase [Cellulomonas sp. PhB143]